MKVVSTYAGLNQRWRREYKVGARDGVRAPKGRIGSFFGGGKGRKAVRAAQGKQGDVSGMNGGGEETAVLDLTAEDSD